MCPIKLVWYWSLAPRPVIRETKEKDFVRPSKSTDEKQKEREREKKRKAIAKRFPLHAKVERDNLNSFVPAENCLRLF